MHCLRSLRFFSNNVAFKRSLSTLVSLCLKTRFQLFSGRNLSFCNTESLTICNNRTFSRINSKVFFRKNLPIRVTCTQNALSSMSTLSLSEVPSYSTVLRLGDYDCIGFDLDNTLCEYNISSTIQMEYDVLANFLVKEKGYDPHYLLKPLDEKAFDFLQKGLVVDFYRGNVLKLGENGLIYKATHGTRCMTEEEVINSYGKDKRWDVTNEFSNNMLVAWNGPLSERIRAVLDYFDMPASLAFARIIDSLDHKVSEPVPHDGYNVWPDVLAGLHDMYKREHFSTSEGGFFQEVKSNPQKYIKPCMPDVLKWLRKIKESKMTFLITGSNCDFASLTAETGLGKNWRNLFDIVICYARKPGFFSGCRPFIELDGFKETKPLESSDLEFGNIYNQGNWQDLYTLFSRKLGKQEPRCLYFGDNLIQDVYTPSEYTKCDTVAVVEELNVERVKPYRDSNHPSQEILMSQIWGSYFCDTKESINTHWSSVISNYSKICIPTLSVLAQYSMYHEFETFNKGPINGYFPFSPTFKKKCGAL